MGTTMNNSINSASAAAKAAKTDFSAPVAANRARDERADGYAAQNRQPAYRAAAANSAASHAPAKTTQANASAHSGKSAQAGNSADAGAHGDEPVAEAPMPAPFAQMLTLADLAAAAKDHGDSDAADAEALPAMVTSMLNVGTAPAAPLAVDGATRADAVSAVATLNASATRLNLSAAGVAVNPAATPRAAADGDADAVTTTAATTVAAARAVAQLQATPGMSAQGVHTPASGAAQGAGAPPTKAEATVAGDDANGAVPAAKSAPAPSTETPAVAAATIASATPRAAPRGAETASAGQRADAGAAMPANATVAKDESRVGAAPAGNATTAGVGFTTGTPAAPAATATTVKLAGTPEQWQQPLREALGERLQVNLQRNNDHAVIRLEPPNMGSIEISIRHSAGSLQVSLTANNSEVLRQLNTIGDSVRQDLSTRQFSDVAVTVSASRGQGQAQSQPDGGGRNGQQRDQDDGRTPGRALSEDGAAARFAMTSEQE